MRDRNCCKRNGPMNLYGLSSRFSSLRPIVAATLVLSTLCIPDGRAAQILLNPGTNALPARLPGARSTARRRPAWPTA